jgi:hypothetical protein
MKKSIVAISTIILAANCTFAVEKSATALRSQIPKRKPPLIQIKVQTPNGGETWIKGGVFSVTWTTVNVAQNVNIILKDTSALRGGKLVIANNIAPNAGRVFYSIPTNLGIGQDGKFFKVIISTTDGKVSDESNDTFTIRARAPIAYLYALPAVFNGPCPATINFKGSITAAYPYLITYFFSHDDGTKSPDYQVSLLPDVPQAVYYSRQIAQSGSGHVTLYVIAPVNFSSNTAFFTVNCN